MVDVRIESMQISHLTEVLEIEKMCFSNPWSLESFRNELTENPRALYLVALYKKRVIGYIGNWIICNEGHITNLAVHPKWQKLGVGEKLIRTLIEISKVYDVYHFTLEVRVSNLGAKRLYRRLGFEEVGLRKKYYQNNQEDAIIMWKHIDQDEEA